MKPLVTVFNVETQEEIVREMTDQEYEQHLADQAFFAAKKAQEVTE